MRDRVRKAWNTIETVLAREDPEAHASLAPGASEEQVRVLEQALGTSLPQDFRESLRHHNGQRLPNSEHSFVDHGFLLPCALIAEMRDMLNQIDAEVLDQIRVEGRPIPPGEWWNRNYVPFLDANGNMLCVDLDATHRHQFGEVVWHVHDGNVDRGVAPLYIGWLEKIAGRLDSGQFKVGEFGLSVVSNDFGI
jgi:cell wall assembly regulator SMI1